MNQTSRLQLARFGIKALVNHVEMPANERDRLVREAAWLDAQITGAVRRWS